MVRPSARKAILASFLCINKGRKCISRSSAVLLHFFVLPVSFFNFISHINVILNIFELFVRSVCIIMGFSHVRMEWFYTCNSYREKRTIGCTTGSILPSYDCRLYLGTVKPIWAKTRMYAPSDWQDLWNTALYRWTHGYVDAVWLLIAFVRYWEFGVVNECMCISSQRHLSDSEYNYDICYCVVLGEFLNCLKTSVVTWQYLMSWRRKIKNSSPWKH